MKLLLSFLALLAFFVARPVNADNKSCATALTSCLKQENLDAFFVPISTRDKFSSHGIQMVLINDQVALLRLSFPRLQYRDLCQQLGLTFKGNVLRSPSF